MRSQDFVGSRRGLLSDSSPPNTASPTVAKLASRRAETSADCTTEKERVSNVIQLFGAAKVASSGANGGDDVEQATPRNDGGGKSTTNRPRMGKRNLPQEGSFSN
jgi:hypothetical protein